jgi:hypothetical protein
MTCSNRLIFIHQTYHVIIIIFYLVYQVFSSITSRGLPILTVSSHQQMLLTAL